MLAAFFDRFRPTSLSVERYGTVWILLAYVSLVW